MKNTRNSKHIWIIAVIAAVLLLAAAVGWGVFAVVRMLPTLWPGRNLAGENALQLPLVLQDEDPAPDAASYTLNAQTGTTHFLRGRSTPTMGYNGSFLGPVIRMKQGEKVSIRVNNLLDEATTVHWHGLVVSGDQDGGPHQVIDPGESWSPSFTVTQPAATLWFHPHALTTTATQVYSGLAGLIYIDDPVSERLNLPKEYGINDFPLIVQDRNFNQDGTFSYQTTMMGLTPGDTFLVNGTIQPYLAIRREKIRLRILNASNSEDYLFRMSDDRSFWMIASDGGFLESPVSLSSVALAPGERAEVILDFSETTGDSVHLMLGDRKLLNIRIQGVAGPSTDLPETLAQITPIPVEENPIVRVFELQSMGISGSINGKAFDQHRIDEEIRQGETEIWIIRNQGGMMMQSGGHPFHVHGTQFQVLSRNGQTPPPEERGFKDTVFVGVGEAVEIRIRFSQPGIFMYHCHILEHEENGMMGQVRVR